MTEKPRVFIAHTSDAKEAVLHLKKGLGDAAEPITLRDTPSLGRTLIESLISQVERADFAIVVVGQGSRPGDFARENVLFELGMLMGALGPSRVLLLAPDLPGVRFPSDLSGIATVRYDPATPATSLVAAITMIRNAITHRPEPASRVEHYSCFLSYNVKDSEFVKQIHTDLQEAGVRCWLDSQEIRIGESLIDSIQQGLSSVDRVLLVLSTAALQSPWVRRETELALKRETGAKRTLLFPLRVDDEVLQTSDEVFSRLVSAKHIADFTKWQDRTAYRQAFSRLVRDLTVAVAVESKERAS